MDEKEILEMALGLTGTPWEVCADMSPTYAKGIRAQFPDARLVFDFFHVVQLLTTPVDIPEVIKVAKSIEAHWNGIVSCLETRLINVGVKAMNLKTAVGFLTGGKRDNGDRELRRERVRRSPHRAGEPRLPEKTAHAVATLLTPLTPVKATTGLSMNGIIQTAKRKARGFRSFLYFQTIIYLVGSKLTFDLLIPIPTPPPQTT